MARGYPDTVQLVQMQKNVPDKCAQLVNLKALSSMEDFWRYKDEDYVDAGEMARYAI